MKRYELDGKVALITGAASGIGRATAISLARRGAVLALADINADGLAETTGLVEAEGGKASQHVCDLAIREQVDALPRAVFERHGTLDLLINNAGVTILGDFQTVTANDMEWVIGINLIATMRLTKAALPFLIKSRDAHIVNISSILGITAMPGQAAYSASKFGVRGFSQSLRYELRKHGIGVTVVHPGAINTNIIESARMVGNSPQSEAKTRRDTAKKGVNMPPEQAGEIIARAIEARKIRLLIGNDAKFLAVLERLFPISYWSIVGRISPE